MSTSTEQTVVQRVRVRVRGNPSPVVFPTLARFEELERNLLEARNSGDPERIVEARDTWVSEDSRVTAECKDVFDDGARRMASQAVLFGLREPAVRAWPHFIRWSVPTAVDLRPNRTNGKGLSAVVGHLREDTRQVREEKRNRAHFAALDRYDNVVFVLKPGTSDFDEIKDRVKAAGGRFDEDRKWWTVDPGNVGEAFAIVEEHRLLMHPEFAKSVRNHFGSRSSGPGEPVVD